LRISGNLATSRYTKARRNNDCTSHDAQDDDVDEIGELTGTSKLGDGREVFVKAFKFFTGDVPEGTSTFTKTLHADFLLRSQSPLPK
jgi:hypothetical protein